MHGEKPLSPRKDLWSPLLSLFDLSTAFPLCRYTVVNELNKVDLGEVSVFVYFIMKLSRVEGGTSYVGFHGGGSGLLAP